MKKIILAATVGIFLASCSSKQAEQTVEEQAQAYVQQMEQAIQSGDTTAIKSLTEEINTWKESLPADSVAKLETFTTFTETLNKAKTTIDPSIADAIDNAIDVVVGEATDAAQQVSNEVQNQANKAVNDVKKATNDAVESAKKQGAEAVNKAANDAASAIQKGANDAVNALNK